MAGFKFLDEDPQPTAQQPESPVVGGFAFAPEEPTPSAAKVPVEVDRESEKLAKLSPAVRYPILAARGAARAVPGATDAGAAFQAGLSYLGLNHPDVQSTGPFSERFASARRKQENIDRAAGRSYPISTYGSQVAASLALPLAGPASRIAAVSEPLVGSGVARALGLGTVGAGYGAASGFGEGNNLNERLANAKTGALIGGAGGAAVPAVVDLAGGAANKAVNFLALRSPASEAKNQFIEGMQSAGRFGGGMSETEARAGLAAGQPVLPIDLGGAVIKQAAKTATHANPQAKDVLLGVLDKRNAEQQGRLYDFASGLVGKPLDDPNFVQSIQSAAQAVNTPAYATAMSKGASGVWNGALGRIVNHPWVRQAIPHAIDEANANAIAKGLPPVDNPFVADAAGNLALRVDANGNQMKPTLEMWDTIKKNIDGRIRAAESTPMSRGEPNVVRQGRSIVGSLTKELDALVPEYATARSGAGRYLGEENAYRFGAKFLSSRKASEINDGIRRIGNFSPEEREYAQHSYMAERVQKFMNAPKNRDVGKMMSDPTQKRKDVALLGQAKADELEAFLLRETMMHNSLARLGGSDTLPNTIAAMKHLVGSSSGPVAGAVAGAGEALWEGGLEPTDVAKRVALGALGGALIGHRVVQSEKAALELANRLVSEDPAVWGEAIKAISQNPQGMAALRRAEAAVGVSMKELAPPPEKKALPASKAAPLLPPPSKDEKRKGRAAGGGVALRGRTAKALISAVERARKSIQQQTESILAQPDEHVVRALSVANAKI